MKLTDSVDALQHVGIPSKDLKEAIAFYESLGFKDIYETPNGEQNVAFMQHGDLVIELYDHTEVAGKPGAIHHIALNCTDIDTAYAACQELGCSFMDHITPLPFWSNGIKYFSILGPNSEVIEVCQKL